MSKIAVDRKALKVISNMPIEVRSYLLDKLEWRNKYFLPNYPRHTLQSNYSAGIDRKALKFIHLITNAVIKQFLLDRLLWNKYYSCNY